MFDAQSKSLYDVAQEVEYLDMVLSEALRMYSPAPGSVILCCTIAWSASPMLTASLDGVQDFIRKFLFCTVKGVLFLFIIH